MDKSNLPIIPATYIYGDRRLGHLSLYLQYSNRNKILEEVFPDILSLDDKAAYNRLENATSDEIIAIYNIFNADSMNMFLNYHYYNCDSPAYVNYETDSFHVKSLPDSNEKLVTLLDLEVAENASMKEVDNIQRIARSSNDSILMIYSVQEDNYHDRSELQQKRWNADETAIFNDDHLALRGSMDGWLGIPVRDWLYDQKQIFNEVHRQIKLSSNR